MLADVSFSIESIAVVGTLLAFLAGTVTYVFRLLQENQKARFDALETELSNYKQLTREAVGNLRKAANNARAKQGLESLPELEDVVPEHSSPATAEQTATAELATLRAALVASTKDMGLDPRPVDPAVKAAEISDRAHELAEDLKLAEELANQEEKPEEDKQ